MKKKRAAFVVSGLIVVGIGVAPASADTIFYQGGFSDELFRMDTVTGVETKIGNMGGVADSWGFAFSPLGILYGFNRGSQSLYTIDTATAAVTFVGNSGLSAEALAFASDGSRLYATDATTLYSIDPFTAAVTLVGNIGTSIDGLSVSPTTQTVSGLGTVPAGTLFGVDTHSLYIIDTVTPGSTSVGNVAADETLTFSPDGTLYGHDDAGSFVSIDLATLGSSSVGSTSYDLVFASAAIPEPSTFTLLGVAAGVLYLRCGRRR